MNSSSGVAGALTNQAASRPPPAVEKVPSSWNIGTFHHGNPIYVSKAGVSSGIYASQST